MLDTKSVILGSYEISQLLCTMDDLLILHNLVRIHSKFNPVHKKIFLKMIYYFKLVWHKICNIGDLDKVINDKLWMCKCNTVWSDYYKVTTHTHKNTTFKILRSATVSLVNMKLCVEVRDILVKDKYCKLFKRSRDKATQVPGFHFIKFLAYKL